jgi:type II secretory pathway pseudopilin PulG
MPIEGPHQEPERPEGADDEAQQDTHESAPELPPPIPPPNIPIPPTNDGDTNQEKNYRLSQEQFVVATITLVVLAIYTAIAGYQAWKMRQATTAAQQSAEAATSAAQTAQQTYLAGQKSADDTLAEMQKQSKAMQGAANAAESAAGTAKETLLRGQRPWVGLEKEPEVSFNEGKPGIIQSMISVFIKNYGPSPALHLGSFVQPADIGSRKIEDWVKSSCQLAEISVVTTDKAPGISWGIFVLPNQIYTINMPILNPEKPFNTVVGCIAYTDQFHNTPINSPIHHTSFCYQSYGLIAPKQPRLRLFGCNFAQSMD